MSQAHHEHGPSSLDYKSECPGYMKDKDADTSRAERGQLLHTARETGNLSLCPDEVDAGYVQKCIDYIAKVKAKMPDCVQLDEHRMEIAGGVTFGTGDCFLISADTTFAHYFDTKFAWNKQAPLPRNLQMKSYGPSGIMHEYPRMKAVKVHLLYPQLDIVETHTYFREDQPKTDLEIKTVIARVEYFNRTGDVSVLNPDTVRCGRCGRKGCCPKLWEWLVPMANRYQALPFIGEVHASRIKDPGVEAAKYYEVAEIIEQVGSSAKKHLKELAMKNGGFRRSDGTVIYNVVTRGQGYDIADKVKLLDELAKLDVDANALLAFSTISISKVIEHIAKTKAPKGGKTKFTAELKVKLAEAGAIVEAEPILVLEKPKAVEVEATVTQ